MNFLGLGPGELLLVMILALIVFGPGKLPEIGQGLGRAVREFRRATDSITQEFSKELSLDALTNPEPQQPAAPPPAAAPQRVQPVPAEQSLSQAEEPAAPTSTAPAADTEIARPVLKRVRRAGAVQAAGNGDGVPAASAASKMRRLRAAATRGDQAAPDEGRSAEAATGPQGD